MQTKQLFFEDMAEGMQIPSSVNKINLIDMIRYAAAKWSFFLLHLEKDFAQRQGFRDANIQGSLYGVLCAKLLTDWMGIDGNLRKLSYDVRVMGFPGDTLTCNGRVIKKYNEGKVNLAHCEMWVQNQNGEKVASASATIDLPSRVNQ